MSTVFILGAGASMDIGLPSGEQLRGKIAKEVDFRFDQMLRRQLSQGNRTIYEAIHNHVGSDTTQANEYFKAGQRIATAIPLARSIDELINRHPDDEHLAFVAKLAIANAIRIGEARSLVTVDPSNIHNKMNMKVIDTKTWYKQLFDILFSDCSSQTLEPILDHVSFVVFNYDRCLEYVLYHMIKDFYYDLDPEQAANLVKHANIYHPYGMVGIDYSETNRGFLLDMGDQPTARDLLTIASELKTFTEGTDSRSSEIVAIRKAILDADQIVCLGFAYHPINLRLLATDASDANTAPFYGTAMGISEPNLEVIKSDIGDNMEHVNIKALVDQDCKTFLENYGARISRTLHNAAL